jgi:alkanesulfonate monooxygenase SsuD/methylene tetrahydromethanopterin reductase-like flavin-dependent oxidoreductase (luciferase family)
VRFSLCVDPGRPWAEVLDLVRCAEALGLDGAYVCDHFMPYDPDGLAVDGAMLEGWTTLAALAGHTERLRLGTLVLGSTHRHPAVVANMAATMDHATGGRFVLGLGAGGQLNEHAAYGITLRSVGSRMDAFEEACAAIRSLLREPRTTLRGDFYQLIDAPCDPKPIQSPLPMLIGGGGERRTLRIAAQFADEWHVWATAAEFRRKSDILDRHCEDLGRDPSTIGRVTGALINLSTGAADRDEPSVVAGPPAMVLDQLGAYQDAGVDEFIVRDHRDTSLAAARDDLSSLCAEVVAVLR